MKTGTAVLATLFAIASFPLLAQQPPPASQPDSPTTQQNPQSTQPAQPESQTAAPEASPAEMSPVSGELVSKLDTKTAKTGDSIVVQTKASAKTADGTEIPEGSKLVGHVLAVKPSAAGENSQVALQFDHVELKGGQNIPVHSQIESIAPAGGATSSGAPAATSGSPAGGSSTPGASGTTPAGNSAPAAGTVVAKTGNIAISTTSVPGVLLANNAPGQQDPRMAQASSILLGAKQDIHLDGGTQMVVDVSAAGKGTQ